MNQLLSNGFRVGPISKSVYDEFRRLHEPLIFPNRFDINVRDALSPVECEAENALARRLGSPYELRLGFFHGDKLIGWSYGIQISPDTFRMATTGIEPEYQRKGLYTSFLAALAQTLQREGFQVIYSRHYATDNQVIIPKLHFGFLISGLELTDEYGLLVRLCYFFNETRRKILHVRSGLLQPDDEVQRLIRKYD